MMSTEVIDYTLQYPKTWHIDNLILLCEVGSTAHGTGMDGIEDFDQTGICLVPEDHLFGLKNFETMVWRPGRGPGDKSEAGDLDLTIYSLHKWVRLALKANPSILSLLWAPVERSTARGLELRAMSDAFISRLLFKTYSGYMESQYRKLIGEGSADHGRIRKDLVDKYGYDTKFAMHCLRLGLQGIELAETGAIQYPAKERDFLKKIRYGEWGRDEVLAMIRDVREDLIITENKMLDIPEEPDTDRVEAWMLETYREQLG